MTIMNTTVEKVQEEIDALYTQLDEIREALLRATLRWQAAQGVQVGNRLYGRLSDNDPAKHAAHQEVLNAEHAYRQFFAQLLPQAQQRLNQAVQQALMVQREQWATEYHPQVVARIATLHKKVADYPHDSRESYAARYELQQAQFDLQRLWNDYQKELV